MLLAMVSLEIGNLLGFMTITLFKVKPPKGGVALMPWFSKEPFKLTVPNIIRTF